MVQKGRAVLRQSSTFRLRMHFETTFMAQDSNSANQDSREETKCA
jgi:hypothetical protein